MSKTFNAKVGFRAGRFALLTEGTPDTYGTVTQMAAVQSGDMSITLSTAALYGDDTKLDEISEFQSGTLNITSAGESLTKVATLLGHDTEDSEVIYNQNDSPPFVGFGALEALRSKGTTGSAASAFRAWFYPKVKFQEPNDTYTGKGENTAYGGTALAATVFVNGDGNWKHCEDFSGDTAEADANTWLDAKFGV
ncbi:hypothetical protein FACS189425_04850 [Clostridia bacterium]|nr:hypothetical protein FACS189425_04850 [Clostridia bacterium]